VQVRATALTVETQAYGTIRLSVVRNRHGNWEFLASNLLTADSTLLVQRKRSRWSIETAVSGYEAVRGAGSLPVLVQPGICPPCGTGVADVCGAATLAATTG
jgi:hypothetical protein